MISSQIIAFSYGEKLNFTQILHTPWSRVLLEKLTSFQLVKKFLRIFGSRRFISTVRSARYLSLTWASSIQSVPPKSTSWRSILILFLPSTPGSPKRSLSFRFPHQNPVYASPLRALVLQYGEKLQCLCDSREEWSFSAAL